MFICLLRLPAFNFHFFLSHQTLFSIEIQTYVSYCHILHSAISGGIVDNEPAKAVIQKIHQVAGAHNRSYAFRYALQEEQRKLKIKERILIQDVITRWGSVDIACASFLDHPDDKNPEDDSFFQFQAVNNALRRMKWPKDKIQSLVFT